MSNSPLVVENLSFKYRTRSEIAIEKISFDLGQGELLLIAGSSGCGKTTLARCINGLIPRSYRGERDGKVLLYGREVADLKIPEMAQMVGTLLQDPERQIVASNVYNEIAFGPENLGLPRDEIVARIEQVMKRLNIEYLRERETFNLSGGEKQKVALAGLLAMNPSILLLDEPLASLDPVSAHEALEVFRSLADEGKTVILIEHRVEDAIEIKPDRLLYMENGQVKYLGTIHDLPPEIDHKQVKLPAEWVIRRVKASQETIPAAPPPKKAESGGEPLVVFEDVDFRYDDAAAYGPWVGFLAGFIGNTLGDALSGWGFYWNWSLGNGLMGLVAGLVMVAIKDFRARGDIIKAVGWGIAGIAVGMLFASLTEMFVGGIDLSTALVGYFTPAFLGNLVVTVILLPILMIAFAAVASRRGR